MFRSTLIFAALAAAGSSAEAEVKSSSPAGFEVESRQIVQAAPERVFAALGEIGGWWSGQHSYSGSAANMSLGLKAGDCFCERLANGGSVEHMRVVFAQPGRLLRLQGGLGPLQQEAALGTLTFTLKPVAGGTEIVQSYVVGGYIRSGAEKLAPMVDKVLAEQLAGLAGYLGDKRVKSSD